MSGIRVVAANSGAEWSDAVDLVAEYTEVTAEEIGREVAAVSKGFAILRAEVPRQTEPNPMVTLYLPLQ